MGLKTTVSRATYFHKHAKSQGLFHFTTSGISILPLQNKPTLIFSSHIARTRILKDIIRPRPAQLMTNHPDAWQILPFQEALRGLWSVCSTSNVLL